MSVKAILVIFGASSIAAIAAPASSQEVQTNSVTKDQQQAERKICRWSGTTGSFRRERICLTAEQWRKVDEHLAKEQD